MAFALGFLVWIVFGVVLGVIVPRVYGAAGTERIMDIVFGVCGAFIGGMLGTSAHIFHDATPLRVGGLIGALLGATFFTFLYHFIARKAV
ncbi:MAG TPA: GlsB/YeaQ/YmgE family stress response membrane protein [Longimicrobiales bacterium]|nr:GlsB/YeaQ/YmgE family stress response membrane protein [Longimicrobiales bacterium]